MSSEFGSLIVEAENEGNTLPLDLPEKQISEADSFAETERALDPREGNEKTPFPQSDQFLQKLEETLVPERDASLFWEKLAQYITRETRADIALLFGYREEAREWFLLASVGMPPSFGKQGPLSRAWQSLATIITHEAGRFLFSKDISADRRFVGQMIRGTAVRTFAGTTLDVETRCLGALVIGFNAPNAMTDEDQALFLSCSKQLSPFIIKHGLPEEHPPPSVPRVEQRDPSEASRSNALSPHDPLSSRLEEHPPPSIPRVEQRDPSDASRPNASSPQDPLPSRPERNPPSSVPRVEQKGRSNASGQNAPSRRETSSPRLESVPLRSEEDARSKLIGEALFTALASVFHGEDFYKELLRKIVLAMEADVGYLFRWDSIAQRLFPVASEGVPQEITRRIWRSGIRPDPLWTRALDKDQSLLLPFEAWKPPFRKKLFKDENFKSKITVPIYSADIPWGLLSFFYRSHTVSQKELKLLEEVAEKIGQTVSGVTQWETLLKKTERATVAQNCFRTSAYGMAGLSLLLDSVKETIGAANAYLLRVDSSRGLLVGCAVSTHAQKALLDMDIPIDEQTLGPLTVKQNQPLLVEHAPSDARVGQRWLELFRPRSLCTIPLCWQEQVIGVLILDETAYSRRFTEEEVETLVTLSHSAAAVLATAVQYQEALQRQEHQETLTLSVLRMYEEGRYALADRIEQEMEKTLETVQKGLREVSEKLSSQIPAESPVLQQLTEKNALLEKIALDLKKILADLHVHGLEKQGLLAALRAYVQNFSTLTGIPVTLSFPASIKRNEARFELILYRILQEALCNVRKHAGVCAVVFSIESKENFLHFAITDNGHGFDARRYFSVSPMKRKGSGIAEMKARADLLGGTFFIESALQQGTRVSVKIPLMKREGL